MSKTIAIVGRPNVGKSTLFNRLAGRRLALVDDTPGLTRDRRDVAVKFGDLSFTLIDTAGFEDESGETLSARMQQQTEHAIDLADICLFVIDAREGLTPLDQHFGEILRRKGARVILCANKCEGRAGTDGLMESFSLGYGEPVGISAEHGDGMGDLYAALDAAFADLSGTDEPDEKTAKGKDAPLKLAIVGRPNVGKSTLINALIGEERMLTGPEAGITRDSISLNWQWNGRAISLFDTAGLRRNTKVSDRLEKLAVGDTNRAVKFAEVVVLMMDARDAFEKQDLHIADRVAREGRALIFAINKVDLVDDLGALRKELDEKLERLLPQVRGAPMVYLSAHTGRNLDRLMPQVEKIYTDWNAKIATRDLNDWLHEMEQKHPPPAVQGRRVRLKYISQIKSRPPTFVLFASRAKHLPDSYMRYLTNGLRTAFDLPGTPIRVQIKTGKNPYVEGKE